MAPVTPPKRPPIETKVQAGALAATIAGAAVWVLQTYVFKGTVNPGLASLIYAAVPGALALVAGYFAPHTPRPAPGPAITVNSSGELSSAALEQIKQDLAKALRTERPKVLADPPLVPPPASQI